MVGLSSAPFRFIRIATIENPNSRCFRTVYFRSETAKGRRAGNLRDEGVAMETIFLLLRPTGPGLVGIVCAAANVSTGSSAAVSCAS